MRPLRVGITLGDPGGIGPEIVVKSLASLPPSRAAEFYIFGNEVLFERHERDSGLRLDRGRIFVRAAGPTLGEFKKGVADAANGLASFQAFEEGVRATRNGDVDALVTAPISKSAWALAGVPWRGHTDFLESLFPEAIMTFWSQKLTVALFSHHISLAEAVGKVTRSNLARYFRVLNESLIKAGRGTPELIVAGLNPHSGENGLLGKEEREEILPAVSEARAQGLNIQGPYPADVVFRQALGHPETVVIALYHDQGLIPFKLSTFETGVNVTLGMPFVRTSPDHGTAFDIAGRNTADPRSMSEAIRLAVGLSARPL
jgi:4-hydroxythreonine-4-phosphate dehydrogenase